MASMRGSETQGQTLQRLEQNRTLIESTNSMIMKYFGRILHSSTISVLSMQNVLEQGPDI